jgi:hypothetical protein
VRRQQLYSTRTVKIQHVASSSLSASSTRLDCILFGNWQTTVTWGLGWPTSDRAESQEQLCRYYVVIRQISIGLLLLSHLRNHSIGLAASDDVSRFSSHRVSAPDKSCMAGRTTHVHVCVCSVFISGGWRSWYFLFDAYILFPCWIKMRSKLKLQASDRWWVHMHGYKYCSLTVFIYMCVFFSVQCRNRYFSFTFRLHVSLPPFLMIDTSGLLWKIVNLVSPLNFMSTHSFLCISSKSACMVGMLLYLFPHRTINIPICYIKLYLTGDRHV